MERVFAVDRRDAAALDVIVAAIQHVSLPSPLFHTFPQP
jgi:hypothetical protein